MRDEQGRQKQTAGPERYPAVPVVPGVPFVPRANHDPPNPHHPAGRPEPRPRVRRRRRPREPQAAAQPGRQLQRGARGAELLPLAQPLPLPAHHLLAALPGAGRPLLPGGQRRLRRRLLRPAAPGRSGLQRRQPPGPIPGGLLLQRPDLRHHRLRRMQPVGLAANVLVTLESLVGLLGFALATGILFARFSQPTARILFSEKAIIAPYRAITAFELRVANIRRNEMIQVEAQVLLTRFRRWTAAATGSSSPEAGARPGRLLPPRLDDRPSDRPGEPALRRHPGGSSRLGRRVPGPVLRHRRDLFAAGAHPLLLQGRRDRLGRPLHQPVQPAQAGRRPVDRHRPSAQLRAPPPAADERISRPESVASAPKSTFGRGLRSRGCAWKYGRGWKPIARRRGPPGSGGCGCCKSCATSLKLRRSTAIRFSVPSSCDHQVAGSPATALSSRVVLRPPPAGGERAEESCVLRLLELRELLRIVEDRPPSPGWSPGRPGCAPRSPG